MIYSLGLLFGCSTRSTAHLLHAGAARFIVVRPPRELVVDVARGSEEHKPSNNKSRGRMMLPSVGEEAGVARPNVREHPDGEEPWQTHHLDSERH